MRIVDLNTWIGRLLRGLVRAEAIEPPGHKDKRVATLITGLRALKPDVITFQECLPLPGLARQVASALDYDVIHKVVNTGLRVMGFGFPPGIGAGEGLAILARRELGLRSLGTKRLSGWGVVGSWAGLQLGALRYGLAGRVVVDGNPIIVANAHVRYGFPNREAFFEGWRDLNARGVVKNPTPSERLLGMLDNNQTVRDLELDRLASWLVELGTKHAAPVVVGADLNLDPGAPQVDALEEATGFDNVLPRVSPGALTWDPANNYNIGYGTRLTWLDGEPKPRVLQLMAYLDEIPQTPDHVLFSPGLELRDGGRTFDAPVDGILPSDHYGIWADLEIVG